MPLVSVQDRELVMPALAGGIFFPLGLEVSRRAGLISGRSALVLLLLQVVLAVLGFLTLPGEVLRRAALGIGAMNFHAMMTVFGIILRRKRPELVAALVALPVVLLLLAVGGGLSLVAWLNSEAPAGLAPMMSGVLALELVLIMVLLMARPESGGGTR